jgi:hypothetical protein
MAEVKNDKKVISTAEFEKRVEIEAANLMYFDYMRKDKAFDEARVYVESKFQTN